MSKEQIYDDEIFPLMGRIIKLCQEHKIAMIADFGLDDDLHCTSATLEPDSEPSLSQLNAWELLKPKRSFAMAITEETKPSGDKKITMRRIS